MGLWLAVIALLVSGCALILSFRRIRPEAQENSAGVPDHVWEELKDAIPDADYNYIRTTSAYMASSPSDMIARLNYVGAVHDPKDPKQVRLTILELRLSEQDKKLETVSSRIPSDLHIIWMSLSSVATISSLVALIFYLLQNGYLPSK
ncbi:hypothetical protein [Hoeflea marina]|uniref:hypothetical protein n=1 Tax=Hoeflea marina TaxID=274592 RepID=UPI0011B80339|nr:hypothetical protein [Hoeflea marina]